MRSGSWREIKDQGREQYERGQYEEALSLYVQANSRCSTAFDRQVILSNIVACRLKLGQNERALIDAKECVALKPSWSKAHVRLASAYIAIGASNDACNALQTAIRHDPSNATARQMLLQQLQRDRRQQHNPDLDEPHDIPPANSTRPDDIPSASQQHQQRPTSYHDHVDDGLSWGDWWHVMWGRCQQWYRSQPESRQTGLKVALGILILYVSFGGRFGLEHRPTLYDTTTTNYGYNRNAPTERRYEQQHYGRDDARYHRNHDYDDQASRRHLYDGRQQYRDDARSSYSYGSGNNDYYNTGGNHNNYYNTGGNYAYAGDSPPWHLILILAAVAYLCRVNGMNPWPIAMMLLQGGGRMMMYQGGRRGFRHRRRGRMGW